MSCVHVIIDLERIDAFIFDLDGVVTRTTEVHAAAWKRLFDELLAQQANGEPWLPFDIARDYRMYVDGRARRDGIRTFLASRSIAIAEGRPGDPPDAITIHGLAARKNAYVLAHLAQMGVEVYADAVDLIRAARASGLRLAVVTASENCSAVLAAANLTEAFDARVDGHDLARLELEGKPAPDSFLEGARRLGTPPLRAVVFEDAVAGVRAGRTGQFGLVIGVDRAGHADELRRAGADAVVTSLAAILLSPPMEARP